jgi:hypothetical protein
LDQGRGLAPASARSLTKGELAGPGPTDLESPSTAALLERHRWARIVPVRHAPSRRGLSVHL